MHHEGLVDMYSQIVSSYKVSFFDMDGEEIEIDLPEWGYQSLDQALYEWEGEHE